MEFPVLKRGEESYRWLPQKDGSQKLAYYYRSMKGDLFSCIARSLEDALDQCESWLLRHERH